MCWFDTLWAEYRKSSSFSSLSAADHTDRWNNHVRWERAVQRETLKRCEGHIKVVERRDSEIWECKRMREKRESWWPFPEDGLFNLSLIFSSGSNRNYGAEWLSCGLDLAKTFLCIHYYHGSKLTFCHTCQRRMNWENLRVIKIVFNICIQWDYLDVFTLHTHDKQHRSFWMSQSPSVCDISVLVA